MTQAVSTEDFIETWNRLQSPSAVAKELGVGIRRVYERRNRLAQKGINLVTAVGNGPAIYSRTQTFEKRRDLTIKDGQVLVYSDAHFWPGDPSLAFMALVRLTRALKPAAIIANGDLLDGVRISRHEPRGWQYAPTVKEEIAILVERQAEVQRAAGPRCKLMRTLGNHDIRFERHIATHAPELEGLKGTSLEDFIPDWPCSWSVAINGNTLVKHRWKGGIHATHNNTVQSGWNFVTGHLHSMKVNPFTDLRDEMRFGVDAGCLADPQHDAFDYTEDAPTGWRSGFAILTFREGRLLWPDFCYVMGGRAWYRGEVVL